MVASLATLLQYAALGFDEARRRLPWAARTHHAALAGLAIMAATLLAPVIAGRPPAWHVPRPLAPVIELGPLSLHTTLAFEVGVALATFGFVVHAIHQVAGARRQ
jgi:hypothetical protein